MNFTADTYFRSIDNSIQNRSTVFEFTIVLDNNYFGVLASVSVNLFKNSLVESIFKLSDNTLSRVYSVAAGNEDNEVENTGSFTIVRDTVIVFNNPVSPIAPDIYDFMLETIGIGSSFQLFGIAQSQGLVQVVESAGKLIILV